MKDCTDNCFEWITGSNTAGVTFSQRRFVNKLRHYAEEYPQDVEIVAENEDGSIFAHVPVNWFKFSPPRKGRDFSDEEREIAAKRLADARKKRKKA